MVGLFISQDLEARATIVRNVSDDHVLLLYQTKVGVSMTPTAAVRVPLANFIRIACSLKSVTVRTSAALPFLFPLILGVADSVKCLQTVELNSV